MALTIATSPSTGFPSAPTSVNTNGLSFNGNRATTPAQNALYGYTPKRYSGKILRKFYQDCVLTKIANTEYEGEIKDYGDTVIIRTTPDIEISDYAKGQNLTYKVYQTDVVTLTINKGKYWAFVTDIVDLKQTDLKNFVENWTTDAAKRIKISIEREMFAYMATKAGTGNSGATAGKVSSGYDLGATGSAIVITKDNVIEKINDCGSVMAEQDLPVVEEGGNFWMVIPQWFANRLAASDLRMADRMGTSKSIILDGGQNNVPRIDVFDIYRSNLVYSNTSGEYFVMFGHKSALTFAAQLTQNEALPNPFGFGMLHRGLTIYGFEVIQPKALGMLVCRATAAASSGGST